MNKGYVVGVDSGTQGARVVVADAVGNIVCTGEATHGPMIHLQPGWSEQHPEDNWAKFCQACQEAMAKLPVPQSELAAIGLTGQRGTAALLDEDGNPIRPFVVWMDPRFMDWANWIRQNEPDSYEKTHKISSIEGWLVKQLTGEFKDCIAFPPVPLQPADVARHVWSKDHDVFQTGGVPQDKLLDVYPPGTVYGQVTKAAAAATGLPEGLPVVAGAGDKQCEVLGGGGIAPGQAYVAYGTLSCLCTTVYEQAVIAESGGYWTWGAAVPGAWHLEAGIVGHWMVTWFRDEFCRDAVEEAGKRGVSPEQILNEEAAEIPPGAQGLVVFPYWRPPSYLPQATGLMLGFHDAVHKRPHVFRAILEGIAFELRRGLEVFARDSGVPITDVVVGGGGSKSDLGMQATADIFGVPCKRPHTSETCALGAAISGAAGAGMYSSFAEAAQHMTRSASVFEPIPENVDLYDAMYEKVFTMVCPALAEVFKSITEIRECTLQEQT